jgi:hypothetical protein
MPEFRSLETKTKNELRFRKKLEEVVEWKI